jgi:hypothetical protein
MILSARFLTDVGNINSFEYSRNAEFTEGDALDVYIQLIDASQDKAEHGFKPSGRRYAPAAGATLTVTVDNIDDARKVTRACSQPWSGDASVWKLQIMASDVIRGTANLLLTLVEGGVTRKAIVKAAFRVQGASA